MIVREDLGNGIIRIYSDKGVKIRGGSPEGDYNITYIPDNVNREYTETAIPVDKASGPKRYSKVKILLIAKRDGLSAALISFLESTKEIEFLWHDCNVIEDNALLAQYLPATAQALGKTEEEIRTILDESCILDE